jgi:hypothetical protein
LGQDELRAFSDLAFQPFHFRRQVGHIGVEACADQKVRPLADGRIHPVDAPIEFAQQLHQLETVQVIDAAGADIGR